MTSRIETYQQEMYNSLLLGVQTGNEKQIRYCFRRYKDPDGTSLYTVQECDVAIRLAVHKGFHEIARWLTSGKNSTQNNLLVQLFRVIASEDNQKIFPLLKRGARPDVKFPLCRFNAIHLAAARGFTDILKQLVKTSGIRIDTIEEDFDQTALMLACRYGHNKCVQVLIDANANVNFTTLRGGSSLIAAARAGRTDIIELLIRGKADVNQEAAGTLPLIEAITVSHYAVRTLLNLGASMTQSISSNSYLRGETALKLASRQGSPLIHRILQTQLHYNYNVQQNVEWDEKTALRNSNHSLLQRKP
ncbi:MAG TPA: ankyrin repeat domain-containing protein [Rhabdochlamydiaceae bacterium]|nr:ankyrin repeat domain-containing protein [Rhabdochlamydiaceae bacterium]